MLHHQLFDAFSNVTHKNGTIFYGNLKKMNQSFIAKIYKFTKKIILKIGVAVSQSLSPNLSQHPSLSLNSTPKSELPKTHVKISI